MNIIYLTLQKYKLLFNAANNAPIFNVFLKYWQIMGVTCDGNPWLYVMRLGDASLSKNISQEFYLIFAVPLYVSPPRLGRGGRG
jgi:hypothetical protein